MTGAFLVEKSGHQKVHSLPLQCSKKKVSELKLLELSLHFKTNALTPQGKLVTFCTSYDIIVSYTTFGNRLWHIKQHFEVVNIGTEVSVVAHRSPAIYYRFHWAGSGYCKPVNFSLQS